MRILTAVTVPSDLLQQVSNANVAFWFFAGCVLALVIFAAFASWSDSSFILGGALAIVVVGISVIIPSSLNDDKRKEQAAALAPYAAEIHPDLTVGSMRSLANAAQGRGQLELPSGITAYQNGSAEMVLNEAGDIVTVQLGEASIAPDQSNPMAPVIDIFIGFFSLIDDSIATVEEDPKPVTFSVK